MEKDVTEVTLPLSTKTNLVFSGEIISAKTGDEKAYSGISLTILRRLIGYMKSGDSITINCTNY